MGGEDKLIVHKEQEKEKQVWMLVLGGLMHKVILLCNFLHAYNTLSCRLRSA